MVRTKDPIWSQAFMKESPTDFMNSPGYSWRNATIGSTFIAQRAGM